MRRLLLALTVPLIGAGATLAPLGDGSHLLARFARLRVSDIEVRGTHYLDPEVIRRLVPAYQDKRGGARALEGRVRTHRLIEDAAVQSLPGDIVEIVVRERRPVALVANPDLLNPVDPGGEYLPLDPAVHRLDLPILRPMREQSGTLTISEHQQIQTMAGEMHRLGQLHPDFARSVSEVVWTPRGTLTAHFSGSEAVLHFQPPLSVRRLREGLAVLADALPRAPERGITVADLRFADQVVVRYASAAGPADRRP